MTARWRALALTLVLVLLAGRAPGSADCREPSAGRVRFFRVANSDFDVYTGSPTAAQAAWMRAHYSRMLVYAPYFDTRLTWFPDAWVYLDLYAIYVGSDMAREHPEWILRDAKGSPLYIPFACTGTGCPQYAGDIGSPSFRAQWIAEATARLGAGYRGLFVDDVNTLISRVGDGAGRPVVPSDRRTGAPMTPGNWRRYLAEFTAEIRASFPDVEIVHNPLWFAGRDDPGIQRQLDSADVINLERGVNDTGIRGGTGTFGFDTFLGYIDWLHTRGKHVIFDAGDPTPAGREYGLAVYLLVNTGDDLLGNGPGGTPDDWWSGYDIDLGAAAGRRYGWNGLLRRDFARGTVLVNPPDASPKTVSLEEGLIDLAGKPRTEVTLAAAEGRVLRRAAPEGTP